MDRVFSQAMRGIRSTGRGGVFVVEMIREFSDEDRRRIDNWLRFLREREQRHYTLGAGYYDRYAEQDTRRRFLIKDLPDSTILRLIETAGARRVWDRWTSKSVDEEDKHNWNGEDYQYGRSTYCVIWEEAEYRGLMSKEQQYWASVGQRIDDRILSAIIGKCDRGSHTIVRMNDGAKCADCRKSVSNDKVSKYRAARLRGRLRQFAC